MTKIPSISLTMPPRRKKLYSSTFSLPAASRIFAHMWNEKSNLCRSNRPRHAYLQQKDNKHTHTRLTALCPGLPGRAGTRKVKPIWILLKQETVSGSVISWVVCKSVPRSRQTTTPAPHHSVFYRPPRCPSCRPTNSVKALKTTSTWGQIR